MFYWMIPLVIGIIFLVTFLFFRVKEKRLIAVVFKGLTSLMFILTALIAWLCSKNPSSTFGIFIVFGLFFGLLGDIFLDIKFMTKKHEDLFTRLGFIAFGIGHIFFVSGLFVNFYPFGKINLIYFALPTILAVIFTVAALLMEKFTNIKYGNMKAFAIGYGLVLFFAMNMYCSMTIYYSDPQPTLIFIGAGLVLFTISDMILNNTYFAPGCNTPFYVVSNHICYYLGQFLIACSLFFLM